MMANRKKKCWKSLADRVEEIRILSDKFWKKLVRETGGDEYLIFMALNGLQNKLIKSHVRKNKTEFEELRNEENKDTGD